MPGSNSIREQADLHHLAKIRVLTEEVAAAISAIEHSNLRQLQIAIANQERICSELAAMKWKPSFFVRGTSHISPAISGNCEQIHAAYANLAQLNRVYAGVVKRSKRSVDLLSAVYGNHENGYSQPPSQPTKFQTLSCEG